MNIAVLMLASLLIAPTPTKTYVVDPISNVVEFDSTSTTYFYHQRVEITQGFYKGSKGIITEYKDRKYTVELNTGKTIVNVPVSALTPSLNLLESSHYGYPVPA
jgi:hypothetical protein